MVLLAVTYGELSTMVPLHEVHCPLSTAPLSAVMLRFTELSTSTDPHVVTWALVDPAYLEPEPCMDIVNDVTLKPGAASPATAVTVHWFAVHAEVKSQVSLHLSPTLRLAPPPGVLVVLTCTGRLP